MRFIHKFAILRHPVVVRRVERFPTGEVLAIEERLGGAPGFRLRPHQRWRAHADHLAD